MSAGDFSQGAGYFLTGVKTWATRPKLMLLGSLPALIVGTLMFLLVVWAVPRTYGWAAGITGFADDWALLFREGIRLALGVALAIAIIMVCIVSFVTITLLVGGPFYERIWRSTEQSLGGLPSSPASRITQQVARGVGDAARMLGMALTTSLVAVLIGLVPAVGGLLAALFVTWRGSRALAIELTAYAADARGWTFEQRKKVLDRHPMKALGAAFPCYLAFMVPGGAVLVMPAAVVAGTLLLHDLASSHWSEGDRVG